MEDIDQLSLIPLISVIWRRWFLVVATAIPIVVGAYFIAASLPPIYKANAMVVLEARKPEVLSFDAVASTLTTSPSGIQTEVDVLRSAALAERVIDKLDLIDDPEFNPMIRPPESDLRRLLSALHPIRLLSAFRSIILPDREREDDVDDQSTEMTATIGMFLSQLLILHNEDSYTIEVSFVSTDATKAATVANAVIEQYLISQLESKFEAMQRANKWLEERVRGLRSDVEVSETALQRYKEQTSLIQARGQTVSTQQLSELNTQLIVARTELAEAEARLRRIRDLAKKGALGGAPDVLGSPIIVNLKAEEASLIQREADLAMRYGLRHPTLVNLRGELRDLRAKIDDEIRNVLESVESQVAVARARELTLAQNLKSLEEKVGELTLAEVKLGELQREADANRQLFQDFLARFKETSNQQDVQQPDARIVSRARIPLLPAYPRITLIVAVTSIAATGFGMLLALIADRLDNRIRSMDQLERLTGLPVLGMLPLVRATRSGLKPIDYPTMKPASAYSEALHSTLAGLLTSDKPAKVLLVTSALPGEGKTTFSASLAIAAVRAGFSVVLVDADLRRARVQDILEVSRGPGLTDIIEGNLPLSEVLRQHISGVRVITAGSELSSGPASVSAQKRILASEEMSALLTNLQTIFNLVIIDSAPILAVADANFLAASADATVMVVRWGSSTRQSTELALRQLRRARANIAGIVLTAVDLTKHRKLGHYDQGYYYRAIKNYYGKG